MLIVFTVGEWLVLRLFFILFGLLWNQGLYSAEVQNWYRSASFYHIWLKSFSASHQQHEVGDIQGIIQRFDYLNDGQANAGKDLEVDAILLSPFYLSARSSEDPLDNIHGYDVVDYYQVNPVFGDKADLKQLIDLAHSRGVKVLFDFVPAYTSIKHPWFINSANGGDKRDWYVWDKQPSSQWQAAWGGGSWQDVWKAHGNSYFYSYFQSSEIADLNLHNPQVRQALEEVLKYWFDFGFDGARIDGAPYLIEDGPGKQADRPETFQILREYRAIADSYEQGKVLIAETWRPSEIVSKYFGNGHNQIHMGFDFDFAWQIPGAIKRGNAQGLRNLHQQQIQDYPSGYQTAAFLSNHDSYLSRPMTVYVGNANQALQAATLQLLSSATPFIFYGNELGMLGEHQPDAQLRGLFNWQDVERQLALPNSLLNQYRHLLKIRREHSYISEASLHFVDTHSDKVFAYALATQQQALVVLINTNKAPSRAQLNMAQVSALSTHQDYRLSPVLGEPVQKRREALAGAASYQLEQLPAESVTVLYLGEQQASLVASYPDKVVAPTKALVPSAIALNSLYLRGDMNGWDGSLPMALSENGLWQVKLKLQKGRYQYKFEVNGQPLWGRNWGDNSRNGIGDIDGENIRLRAASGGCYLFSFNPQNRQHQVQATKTCD
ncbi:alpha-amylase family glycosyl hydrolase [Agarivorans sp. JK6]|uniref:alpha-amylase family glycosyl hydrolase n=1 Tax=Agarivorans sp. JK6 TaxID=2997426 RepID=UPI003873BE11